MTKSKATPTERVLKIVTSFYLCSDQFNGIPLLTLTARLRRPIEAVREVLGELVKEGQVSINAGERHPNAHIKALDPAPIDLQLKGLEQGDLRHTCIYPEPLHLKKVVATERYAGRPFTRRLALGEPQLRHAVFDLSVLEFYRNDPRYIYQHDDIEGHISIKGEFYRTGRMRRRDQVLLEAFGFAYNRRMDRAVASFLRYLSILSPDHQSIWQAKLLRGKYELHPDFRASTLGEWSERVSIFTAFLEEIRIINLMATAIGRPPLFRNEIAPGNKPREFGFLIRPTSKEFDDFKQTLDKLIADNLNPDFFRNEIALDEEIPRRDGRVEVQRKGTLRLLEEWLGARFKSREPEVVDKMFTTFRSIRKARNKPAHRIDDNIFDQKYFRQQRKLIIDAYSALKTLRLIFANFRAAREVEVPEGLFEGKINTY